MAREVPSAPRRRKSGHSRRQLSSVPRSERPLTARKAPRPAESSDSSLDSSSTIGLNRPEPRASITSYVRRVRESLRIRDQPIDRTRRGPAHRSASARAGKRPHSSLATRFWSPLPAAKLRCSFSLLGPGGGFVASPAFYGCPSEPGNRPLRFDGFVRGSATGPSPHRVENESRDESSR